MRHHGQDRDRLTVVGFDEISWLRGNSPAWRLLRAENAPLVLSFLDQVFVAENIRSISAAELANRLDDELYALNERLGERAFPKPAKAYLDDWAAPEAGWLRKYYPEGSDEPHFDVTPAVEKALAWVRALQARFRLPDLWSIDDGIANGTARSDDGEPKPLALFTAERVDFSLHRLTHYTATSPRHFQRFVLLTNYQRYVDEFCKLARAEMVEGTEYEAFVEPGDVHLSNSQLGDAGTVGTPPVHLPQMPAYHLVGRNREGITLINIGVGPSNAKTITDHLAVLRPHCWLMLGHCAGLQGHINASALVNGQIDAGHRLPLEPITFHRYVVSAHRKSRSPVDARLVGDAAPCRYASVGVDNGDCRVGHNGL